MADGVFGIPIDDTTLKGIHEYKGMIIRRSDKAKVARDRMSDQGKDRACMEYVEDLKTSYGIGVSTKVTIYNATGGDLNYVYHCNWTGYTYDKPYPMVIKNGQWGGFLHVHPSLSTDGSCGAVGYRGKNEHDTGCDWSVGWSVPMIGQNKVYSELHDDKGNWTWKEFYAKLMEQGAAYSETWNGCKCDEQIGNDTTTTLVAIMSIDDPNPTYQPAA